ncbi:uncharacterized protein KY384_004470 [Bacidia gigantensis]|uniref:uncharacterized protein n=1 Tax=Bacidia gigantensis TaxID=2732470 RepID=UPI001D0499A8|nr:uncharacterized protein KY384_004470 [Bacidia gigantensis]KAG8531113.1 hypothetical protein KY384_004470 [Bacidia gigantensis]
MASHDQNYNHNLEAYEATQRRPETTILRQNPTMTATDHSRRASQQKHVDEAVSSAFDKAETSNYMPPELIAQITQSVIKQLQSTGLDGSTPVPPQQSSFPPPPLASQPTQEQPLPPQSPSTTTSGTSPNMPNRVFTPPSPHRHSDPIDQISPPPQSAQPFEPPMSPSKGYRAAHFSPNRSPSPFSQGSDTSEKQYSRPKGPSRLHSGKEETTLEKIWGPLFDEECKATARLGQFLRGLAVHIIEDYKPQHSIVITPDKMVKYYDDVKLETELYPWSVVFDDERSSISRMYRDLSCQHHLVQERHDERPDIPGLTPVGFERWMTLLILAHPEAEFERLKKAVLEMPINNPDDKKERFPKEITRRLFPKHEDMKTRYMVEDSMIEHASIQIPRQRSQEDLQPRQDPSAQKTNTTDSFIPLQPKPNVAESYIPSQHRPSVQETPTPQNPRPSVSFAEPEVFASPTPSHPNSQIERERAPYANVPESAVVDDMNPPEPPVSKPIERERKPYVSQVGGGRQYEPEEIRPRETSKPRADSLMNGKPARSDSTANRTRPININTGNQQLPKPEIHQHYRAGSNAGNNRRRRSPSFSRGTTADFRRSEPDVRGYGQGYEPASAPVLDESDTKAYFDNQARERARKKAEDDSRNYGASPRRDYDDRLPRRGDSMYEGDYGRRDKRYEDTHRESYAPVYR